MNQSINQSIPFHVKQSWTELFGFNVTALDGSLHVSLY